jgi:tRNA(Ile)-lysidine synthase
LVKLIDLNLDNKEGLVDKFWNPCTDSEVLFGDFHLIASNDGVSFALNRLHMPLRVATFQPGDRMKVESGMTKKLKKLFNEQKVVPALRRTIPVIWSGDEIIWVPGVARSSQSAPKSGNDQVIYLNLKCND